MTSPSTSDPLIGTSIGSYQVVRRLGEGGMGAVYEIVHPGIGKRLALKLLHPEFAAQPEIVRRFFAEARAVNLIGHPNIVDVIDFNQLPDGRPYLTMEFLHGEPLADLIERDAPLAPERVAAIMAPVCAALAAAHGTGVIHRDLKPDNIFLVAQPGAAPRIKVLDFGIAKLSPELSEGGGHTATGTLLGTPAYMAPEQATGQVRDIGPATDVYALGAILYEMLIGAPPFRAETLAALLVAQSSQDPVPLAQHRPDLAGAWDALVMRALAKERAARFAGARELASAIEAAASRGAAPAPHQQPTLVASDLAAGPPSTWTPGASSPAAATATPAVSGSPLAPPATSPPAPAPTFGTGAAPAPTEGPGGGGWFPLLIGLIAAGTAIAVVAISFWGRGGEALPAADAALAAALDAAPTRVSAAPPDAAPAPPDAAPPAVLDAAPRSSDPPPPTERGPGDLVVAASPWAEVSLGGKRLGYTPLRKRLPAGRYTIRLRNRQAGKERRVRIRIRAGETTRIRAW